MFIHLYYCYVEIWMLLVHSLLVWSCVLLLALSRTVELRLMFGLLITFIYLNFSLLVQLKNSLIQTLIIFIDLVKK